MTLSIAILGTGFRPTGSELPPEEILAIKGDRYTATLLETPNNEFPSTPAKRLEVEQAYVELGMRACAEGFDAIYINTVGDYGLTGLREKLDIPVIGSGETAVKVASINNEQFSVITVWPPGLDFIYKSLLDMTSTSQYCRQIIHLSDDADLTTLSDENNFVTDLRSCSITSMDKLQAAIRKAKQQQIGSVILGCTCMAPVGGHVESQSGIPVIEPMTLGYQFAEFWVENGADEAPPFNLFKQKLLG